MPRVARLLLLVPLLIATTSDPLWAQNVPAESSDPVLLFFYQAECPSCRTIEDVIDLLEPDLPPGSVRRYEISDPDAFDLLQSLGVAFEVDVETVPVAFIGEIAIVGSGRAAELRLSDAISDCARSDCPSPMERIRPPAIPWADLFGTAGMLALLLLLLVLQPL